MADMCLVACGTVTKADYVQNLRKFLGDVAFDFTPSDYNLGVENEVKKYFKEEGFSEAFIRHRQPIIQASAGIAMTTYHSTPFDVQCIVGKYTTYALIIDDCTSEMKPEMKYFCTCLLSGKPQGNKLLQTFAHFLKSMHETFGQFGGDMIIKDSLQYISSCYLETEADKRLLFSTNAPDFAYYFRLKTGVAEAYAFMLFPEEQFPEDECLSTYLPAIWYMQKHLNFANDILSFYKESLALEDTNFVHNYAKSHGLMPTESLRRICTEASEVVQRLRGLGKAHPKVSLAIESFIRGYIVYHLSQPRYRLAELELPIVIEAQRQLNIFGGAK